MALLWNISYLDKVEFGFRERISIDDTLIFLNQKSHNYFHLKNIIWKYTYEIDIWGALDNIDWKIISKIFAISPYPFYFN